MSTTPRTGRATACCCASTARASSTAGSSTSSWERRRTATYEADERGWPRRSRRAPTASRSSPTATARSGPSGTGPRRLDPRPELQHPHPRPTCCGPRRRASSSPSTTGWGSCGRWAWRSATVRAGHANMFLSPLFAEAFATVTGAAVELYNTDGAQGAARGRGDRRGYLPGYAGGLHRPRGRPGVEPNAELPRLYQEAYRRWAGLLRWSWREGRRMDCNAELGHRKEGGRAWHNAERRYHSVCRWTFNAGKGGFVPGDIRPGWDGRELDTAGMVELIKKEIAPPAAGARAAWASSSTTTTRSTSRPRPRWPTPWARPGCTWP